MNVSVRKEIEHRACLVPWPNGEPLPFYDLDLSAAMVRNAANVFGHEVIDVHWMRSLLAALASHLESEESLKDGACCQRCGVIAKHVQGCPA